MRDSVLIGGIALVIFAGLVLVSGHRASAHPECAVIHKPAGACPSGYVQESHPSFVEKDGSHGFACFSTDPAKTPCIDVLNPGESFEMHVVVPAPAAEPEPAKDEGPKI